MKRFLLTLALLVPATAMATLVDGVPVPDELMKLARQAVASNSPQEALLRGDNIYVSHPYFKQLLAKLDFNKINEEAAKLMVKTFSRSELYALVEFQKSAEGRSIAAKMPAYQDMVGALIQNQLRDAMQANMLEQGGQGAQSPGVGKVTAPTTPSAPQVQPTLQGEGGSAIGK